MEEERRTEQAKAGLYPEIPRHHDRRNHKRRHKMHPETNRESGKLKEEFVSAFKDALQPKTAWQIAREAGIKALVWSPFIAGITFGAIAFASRRVKSI